MNPAGGGERNASRPSGELVLRIESYLGAGARKKWRDRVEVRFEHRINEVPQGLLTAMTLLEDQEQKRHEGEQRRWELEQERAERERREKMEAARWKRVLDLAEYVRQAVMIGEFIDSLKRRVLSAAGVEGLSPCIQQWFAWTRKRAHATDTCPDLWIDHRSGIAHRSRRRSDAFGQRSARYAAGRHPGTRRASAR